MPSTSNAEVHKIGAPPAGILRRLGALCYDLLLLLALWMTTLFLGVIANGGESISGWWIPIVLYLEAAVYYIYSWLKSGQTLGMRTWRLQLVDQNGGAIAPWPACVRFMVAPLSFAALGLGYLAFYWGKKQQTWHDQLSGSFVVALPKS